MHHSSHPVTNRLFGRKKRGVPVCSPKERSRPGEEEIRLITVGFFHFVLLVFSSYPLDFKFVNFYICLCVDCWACHQLPLGFKLFMITIDVAPLWLISFASDGTLACFYSQGVLVFKYKKGLHKENKKNVEEDKKIHEDRFTFSPVYWLTIPLNSLWFFTASWFFTGGCLLLHLFFTSLSFGDLSMLRDDWFDNILKHVSTDVFC